MSSVDWNQLVAEDEERDSMHNVESTTDRVQGVASDYIVVEQPATPPQIPLDVDARSMETEFVTSGDDDEDFLDLDCNDTSIVDYDGLHENVNNNDRASDEGRRQRSKIDDTEYFSGCDIHRRREIALTRKHSVGGRQRCTEQEMNVVQPRRARQRSRYRKKSRQEPYHQYNPKNVLHQHSSCQTRNRSATRWTIHWIRNGYEELVYDICNSNETPSVIFAGVCYREFDIHTMVLRNCVGKRRFWYDRSERNKQLTHRGLRVDGFERAILRRANVIGRTTTSPGCDLAEFAVQHVASDKRHGLNPLIVVTSNAMFSHPSIYGQFVYTEKESVVNRHRKLQRCTTTTSFKSKQPSLCNVCRNLARVVTYDNASVPTFTCWQHSASYLCCTNTAHSRVCNTIVVDMRFSRKSGSSSSDCNTVCDLCLLNGDGDYLTIAELIASPSTTRPTLRDTSYSKTNERTTVMNMEEVHESNCLDQHYNIEDHFPSMPIVGSSGSGGSGNVQYYDTTIGRIVDQMHCIASVFQR